MIKKTKGFTLLEILIVVGIISLLTATAYGMIAKKQASTQAEKQAQYVNQMITSLNDYFIDLSPDPTIGINQINNIVATPTQLISEKLIPDEMINTASSLKTIWGTPASISAVSLDITPLDGIANNVTGYEISLTNIPSNACSLFASHSYIITKAQRITVNGTVIKGAGVTNPDVGLLSASCNNLNNTINIASDVYKKGIDPIINSNAAASTRNKEGKLYITPTGQNTSTGATTCTGGSAWDSVVSACVCSSTTKWDGKSCVSINNNTANQAGNCATGSFWNQVSRTCQTICPTNQVYNPITNTCVAAPNVSKSLCIPGIDPTNPLNPPVVCQTVNNKVAATDVYEAGRHIPSTVKAPIAPAFSSIGTTTNHTAQIVTSMPQTNANGGSAACPPGARPTLAMNATNNNSGTFASPVANFDGKVCQMCINGYWDNDRCVAR
jgi:prepilin-type N-terminal cleavage/methylation domain-containing protein